MAGDGTEEDVQEVWITNRRRVVLFTIVMIAALALPYFRALNDALPHVHPGVVSMIAGVIVTAVTYIPLKYADSTYGFSHSLMLGFLTAEFCVYGAPIGFPTPVVLSFYFFMFYYGAQEAPHLDPRNYETS